MTGQLSTAWYVLDIGVLLATFLVIFPAELPDKSFIATLVLATRYPKVWVWLGATVAFGIQMVIAVAAGQLLGLLPRTLVLGVTAVLFALGAVLLLRSGLRAKAAEDAEETEEAEEIAAVALKHPGRSSSPRARRRAPTRRSRCSWGPGWHCRPSRLSECSWVAGSSVVCRSGVSA